MTRTTDTPQAATVPEPAADGVSEARATALELYNAEVLATMPGLQEQFVAMLQLVPEPDDDATARIVASILGAETAEELDAAWDAEGMRDMVDQMLIVKAVHKLPSTYTGGLGVFLVCRCEMPGLGEEMILTTGSVSIVAQLVKAHTAGWLPITVVPRKAESRNGYFPMHLELVRQAKRARPAVIDQVDEVPAPNPTSAQGRRS
jgi:hypothetical protein